MQFRTEIPLVRSRLRITHSTPILSLGSCFADRIGTRMQQAKFTILPNPLGILYHPLALSKLLRMALGQIPFPNWEFAEHMGLWHSFDLHGSLRGRDQQVLTKRVGEKLEQTRGFLHKTDFLLLTLGTAWVYERQDSGEVVANCHKYPSAFFRKRLLETSEIVTDFRALRAELLQIRPDLQILLTLSPVRHQRDTLLLNSVSKASLRLACHQLSQEEGFHYYPAYELLIDDLRDYRYYSDDLLHPNQQAEQYIWEHFGHTFFGAETQRLLQSWEALQKSLMHRPQQVGSKGHVRFLQKLARGLLELSPLLDLEEELEAVQEQLAHINHMG